MKQEFRTLDQAVDFILKGEAENSIDIYTQQQVLQDFVLKSVKK